MLAIQFMAACAGRAGLGFTRGKQLVCVLSYQGHAPLSVMPQSTFSCT